MTIPIKNYFILAALTCMSAGSLIALDAPAGAGGGGSGAAGDDNGDSNTYVWYIKKTEAREKAEKNEERLLQILEGPIDLSDTKNSSPLLFLAADADDLDSMEILLKRRANPNAKHPETGDSILLYIAHSSSKRNKPGFKQ